MAWVDGHPSGGGRWCAMGGWAPTPGGGGAMGGWAPTSEKMALTADMRVGAKEGSKGRGVVGGLQAVAWEGPTVVRVELQAWAACGHHSRDLGWEGVAVITPVCCSSNHCVHMGPTLVQFTCDHL